MRTGTVTLVLILAGLAVSPVLLRAATPVFWTVATQADFLRGEVEHVSIDSDGRVVLGSTIDPIAVPATPALWAAVTAAGGGLYLASGHDGRVYRVAPDGRLSVVSIRTSSRCTASHWVLTARCTLASRPALDKNHHRHIFIDKGDRAMFHFTGGITLSMNV